MYFLQYMMSSCCTFQLQELFYTSKGTFRRSAMAADTKAAGGPPHVALRVALGLVYCTGAILRYIVCKIIFLLSDYAGLKSVESFVCGQLKKLLMNSITNKRLKERFEGENPFRRMISVERLVMYIHIIMSNALYKEAYQGLPAPDGDVIDLESKKVSTLLSFAKKGRPFVLNFGSYT
ncbi:hypothetical protein EB796_020394 [Bugula neritina]|uniref:Iodothyronine deiodinase n=1 Tax=Bugula neritina TaxID=10212 RepID=A0A7J7J6Y7_BUGNE|nr:hypothetical protein EB796_020394 [Bugula neritina]